MVGALPSAAHELPLRLEVPGRRTQVRLKARIVYRAAANAGANGHDGHGVGIFGAEFINTGAAELRLARTLRRIVAAL